MKCEGVTGGSNKAFYKQRATLATLMGQRERQQEKSPIPLEPINAIIHTQRDKPFVGPAGSKGK